MTTRPAPLPPSSNGRLGFQWKIWDTIAFSLIMIGFVTAITMTFLGRFNHRPEFKGGDCTALEIEKGWASLITEDIVRVGTKHYLVSSVNFQDMKVVEIYQYDLDHVKVDCRRER